MNTLRNTAILQLALTLAVIAASSAEAALPIDLEVVTESGVPLSAPQEWARLLGRMDLGSVRLRGARGSEQPNIETQRLGTSPRYRVLAVLTGGNELLLPDRRFRVGDRKALQKYFEQLPAQASHNAEERGRFGLTETQFRQLYAELSEPVGFSTAAKPTSVVSRQLVEHISVPIARVGNAVPGSSTTVNVELQELTTGTALAYVLRCDGLALRPEQLPGQPMRLVIEPYNSKQESWPVGWKPAVSSRKAAPHLYEKRNIEINGFTLAQTLTALQPAIRIPVLTDDWVLAQREIDPAAVEVTLKKQRTFLKAALGKLLSQAKLAEEVRVDESEKPFVWVTRFGKNSRPAVK